MNEQKNEKKAGRVGKSIHRGNIFGGIMYDGKLVKLISIRLVVYASFFLFAKQRGYKMEC